MTGFSAPFAEHAVELVLGLELRQQVVVPIGRRHRRQGARELLLLGAAAAFRAQAGGQALERFAHLVEGSRLLRARRRDDRAAVRDQRHEALCLEVPQGLADHRPADAEPLAQLSLH
jgi:hypothetical protein